MADRVAVTNTSPVIALAVVDALPLLDALFDRVIVPPEVWEELLDKPGATEPDRLRSLRAFTFLPTPKIPPEALALDDGERAAIAHAMAIPGAFVLLDEIAARRVAEQLGLPVRGTLGILVEGKRRGLVPAVRPLIEMLLSSGVRLAPNLVASICAAVGE